MAEETATSKNSSGFWEKVQNMGIFIAMLMGFRKGPQPGTQEAENSRIPDWLISLLPESFTLEDESWRLLILGSCSDPRATEVEGEFRRQLGEDSIGYDAGKYRQRLMHARKEFLAEARRPAVKNEKWARVKFEPITFRDPCNLFLLRLIAEADAGGTPEEIYERQKQFAIRQNFLVPMGGLKKGFQWCNKNKGKTLALLLATPFIVFSLITILLYLVL
jgi:hypothetical protein